MTTESREHTMRACLACKEKKIRCQPSEEAGAGRCRRCYRMAKECVFPEPHIRPSRKRFLNRRLEQLEKNFDNITALLATQRPQTAAVEPEPTASVSPPASTENALSDRPLDIFDAGLVTVEYADGLLKNFIYMAPHFPFVVLPPGACLSSLRCESPMLLHAITVTASWQNKNLQLVLEQEYLKVLSMRLVLDGQKGLDILQSLLVYVGWFHFHAKLEKQQISRLTALLVALASDLGLSRRPNSEKLQMALESHPVLGQGVVSSGPDFWNREARRAFVGVYVFSSSYYQLMRKPNPMRYTGYILECAESLAAEGRVPSDALLVYYVRMTRHAEEVCETFGYSDHDKTCSMNDDKKLFYINMFSAKLNEWKANIPSTVSQLLRFDIWCLIFEAYSREVGLYGTTRSSDLSITSASILFDCLMYAESYFDAILTLSLEELQRWTALEWAWLSYSIVLVSKVSLTYESLAWNVESARTVAHFKSFLDSLSARFKELNALVAPSKGSLDWYHYIILKLENTKRLYEATLDKREAEVSQAGPDPTVAAEQPPLFPSFDSTKSGYQALTSFDPLPFGNPSFWMTSETDPWPLVDF